MNPLCPHCKQLMSLYYSDTSGHETYVCYCQPQPTWNNIHPITTYVPKETSK